MTSSKCVSCPYLRRLLQKECGDFDLQKCNGFLPVPSYMMTIMMNSNKMPTAGADVNETGSENGKEVKQLSDDTVTLNRRFGVMDLWRIRSNARTFRIHNRIPRL